MKNSLNIAKNWILNNGGFVIIFFLFFTGIIYSTNSLSNTEIAGIVFRGILLLFFVLYASILICEKRMLQNKYFYIFFAAYVLLMLFSIIINRLLGNINDNIIFVFGIGDVFLIPLSLFTFLEVLKNKNNNSLISYTLIAFGVLTISISLIKDFNELINLFSNYDHSNYDITSIFVDKNTFGYLLFISGCACVLEIKRGKKWVITFLLIFFVYSAIIRSKTSVALLLFLLLFGFFYVLRQTSKKQSILLISITSFLVIFMLTMVILRIGFFDKIYSVLFDQYGLFYDAKIVVSARIQNWKYILLSQSNPFNIIFGFGERTPRYIFGTVDNCYLYNYVCGGILKLMLYLFLIYYLFKENKTNRLFCIFLSLIIMYGFFQDYQLLGLNFYCVGFFTILKAAKY